MLKSLFAVGVAIGLWLASIPADAQSDPNCNADDCQAGRGVIVIPLPNGGAELGSDPACMAQCARCRGPGEHPCPAHWACLQACGVDVDPQTRSTRVPPACAAQCPTC